MKKRSDIDGLRAIAVLPVILFHAGVPLFSGGFAGVDIFFVISGYLLSYIVIQERRENNFSFVNFYERRARRILPVLIFIVSITLPIAYFLLSPVQLKEYGQSLIGVTTFSSNFVFWFQSGYFAEAAENKPLLHTWSLAVEEQYYLILPFLFCLMGYLGTRRFIYLIGAFALLSLFLSEIMSRTHTEANFYLLPTRAWELLAGTLCAFYVSIKGEQKSSVFAILGLGMILLSFLIFDQDTRFPSGYALLPVIGTVLILLYSQGTIIDRFLSLSPIVGIGLISYSAYLWHQLILAFYRLHTMKQDLFLHEILAVLCVTLSLSYLSWRYIEQPFRKKKEKIYCIWSRKKFAIVSVISFVAISCIGGYFVFNPQIAYSYISLSDDKKRIYEYLDHKEKAKDLYLFNKCFMKDHFQEDIVQKHCINISGREGSIFLWGDSHAAALAVGLRAKYENFAALSNSGCGPYMNYKTKTRFYCQDNNSFILEKIRELQPATILIHANWVARINILDQIDKTLSEIKLVAPNSKIIIIGGVPQWHPSLPEKLISSKSEIVDSIYMKNDYQEVAKADNLLRHYAQKHDVQFISYLELICDDYTCLSVVKDGNDLYTPMMWDYGHLTKPGSNYMADKILDVIQ